MVKSWEHYVFEEHRAIALSPWQEGDLDLLDILIKFSNRGFYNGPILHRVGSLITLADPQSKAWSKKEEQIQDGRAELLRNATKFKAPTANDVFFHKRQANLAATFKSSRKSLAGLLGSGVDLLNLKAAMELKTATSLSCVVETVTQEKVNPEFLDKLVDSGHWKPNTNTSLFQWPTSGMIDLWVVTEIKYAESLTLRVVDAGVQKGEISAAAPAAGPISVGLNLEVSIDNAGSLVVKAPPGRPIPVAFKTTRLRYKHTGKLLKKTVDLKRPEVRAGTAVSTAYNPDEDPEYHMLDLFSRESPIADDDQAPADEPDSDGSFSRLPLVFALQSAEIENPLS